MKLSGISRAARPILFSLALAVIVVAALAGMFSKGEKKDTDFSFKNLMNGSYFAAVADNANVNVSLGSFYTKDHTAPSISLLGGNNPTLEKGTSADLDEYGYIAMDNADGDLTGSVVVTEEENRVAYTVTDSSGNSTTVYRDATFVDTLPPELTLIGGTDYELPAHEPFVDPGFTAIDLGDGDVSCNVTVTGEVDNRMIGESTLTYTVTDSMGNTTMAERTVHVVKAEELSPIQEGDKVIYLTFDDGPYMYTQELLDVLDKYDIRVTFFVTDQFDEYIDIIGEEYRRGHSVAVHTYHHDFYDIYSSVDAYFADFDKMQDIIREQTGTETNLFRFPGGSSNTISNFSPGIITAIANEASRRGLYYFDWNVSSGDASGAELSPEDVFHNVTSDILANDSNYSVVLQHDIKEFSVQAVESIILWGLENGYKFRPLDETSFDAHHTISN